MKITTPRLIMREFTANDWPAVLAYQSHPLYLRYYHWTERAAADVQAFVQMFLDDQQTMPRLKFQLALTLKNSGQLIGNCGIRQSHAGSIEADIGYELAPTHWGQGYATEAAGAILHFGFCVMGLHRVCASTVADNVGSARVLAKAGMQPEGRLRENAFYKGRYWDTTLFGILETEWGTLPPIDVTIEV